MLIKIYNFGKDKMLVSTLSTESSLNAVTICNIVFKLDSVLKVLTNILSLPKL